MRLHQACAAQLGQVLGHGRLRETSSASVLTVISRWSSIFRIASRFSFPISPRNSDAARLFISARSKLDLSHLLSLTPAPPSFSAMNSTPEPHQDQPPKHHDDDDAATGTEQHPADRPKVAGRSLRHGTPGTNIFSVCLRVALTYTPTRPADLTVRKRTIFFDRNPDAFWSIHEADLPLCSFCHKRILSLSSGPFNGLLCPISLVPYSRISL